LPIYAVIAPKAGFSEEYQGIVPKLFGTSLFYFTVFLVPTICLARDFVWK
jgi:phospholipid-transporting ATPase